MRREWVLADPRRAPKAVDEWEWRGRRRRRVAEKV